MAVGGVAIFPSDTVYGLACDAQSRVAVERLYRLKRRRLDKPSAVMFFDPELALAGLPELGRRTREALGRLLPGAVSVLLPNPARRFPLACGADPLTLGLRVPDLPELAPVRWPVLQSSANLAGGVDARELGEVAPSLRQAADLVIDGGRLPGTASTVVDLRGYEERLQWRIVRAGAVSEERVASALRGRRAEAVSADPGDQGASGGPGGPTGDFHFDPDSYGDMIRTDIPAYDEFQSRLVLASEEVCVYRDVERILDLATGTGETARRMLEAHPGAELVGVDEHAGMLDAARARLPADRVDLRVGRLEDPLPEGPFDLVVSALGVHHLDAGAKRNLFSRILAELAPSGYFVLGDVVAPERPEHAVTPLTPGFDQPSSLHEQLIWLNQAGFLARILWVRDDLAIVAAESPPA